MLMTLDVILAETDLKPIPAKLLFRYYLLFFLQCRLSKHHLANLTLSSFFSTLCVVFRSHRWVATVAELLLSQGFTSFLQCQIIKLPAIIQIMSSFRTVISTWDIPFILHRFSCMWDIRPEFPCPFFLSFIVLFQCFLREKWVPC